MAAGARPSTLTGPQGSTFYDHPDPPEVEQAASKLAKGRVLAGVLAFRARRHRVDAQSYALDLHSSSDDALDTRSFCHRGALGLVYQRALGTGEVAP